MSKVIRLNDELLNDINLFIENDKKIDSSLHQFLCPEENYTYLNGELFGDDINAWIKYILKFGLSYQRKLMD